jgi:hypothetical protein
MNPKPGLPTYSWLFWLILVVGLTSILVLTMVTDYWLTDQKPNPLFYVVTPLVDILGSSATAYLFARIIRKSLRFLDVLAIFISVTIIVQAFCEIGLKIIYYHAWQYPGIIWIMLCFTMALGLTAFVFVHWTKLNWVYAMLITIIGYLAGTAASILLTSLTGLSTPGS